MSYKTETLSTAVAGAGLPKPRTDTNVLIQLSPGAIPYSALTFTWEATSDGTNWEQVFVIDGKTGNIIAGGTAISPANGISNTWIWPTAAGYTGIRPNISGIGAGQATFKYIGQATIGQPYTNISNASGAFSNITASGTLSVTGLATFLSLISESETVAITANPGGGQAGAVALTTELNVIQTVATIGDSAKLPPWQSGLTIVVWNRSNNSAQIFGTTTDTINGVAAAVGIAQMGNSVCFYVAGPNGVWACEGTGTGFSGSLPTNSYTNAITARAGGGQGLATALTAVTNRITVCATALDSVLLIASTPGVSQTVINVSTNTLAVFPAAGDAINGLPANIATQLPAGQSVTFTCAVAGQWNTTIIQPREINTAINTVGAATLTAASLVGGLVSRGGTQVAAFSDPTDTAVNIIAALHGAAVGQSWDVYLINNSSQVETVTAGAGVTLSGLVVAQPNSWVHFLMVYSAAGTITMVGLKAGVNVVQATQAVVATADNGTNQTLTAAMVTGANEVYHTSTGGATPTLTTPTAAQIIAAIPGWQIGQSYKLRIINANSGIATVAAGVGVTTSGTLTLATNTTRDFVVQMTGAAAVTMTSVGTGTTS